MADIKYKDELETLQSLIRTCLKDIEVNGIYYRVGYGANLRIEVNPAFTAFQEL